MKVLVVLVAVCLVSSRAAYSNYGGYAGPQASPVVNPNGFLADTPEVAAAKAAHFSEVAKVSSPSGYAPGPYNGAPAPAAPAYQAPAPAYHSAPQQPTGGYYNPTNPSITPQGFLSDTPEIAAAKAAHFAEVAKVNSKPQGPEAYDDGSYRPEYDNPSYKAPAPAPAYPSYSAPAPQSYYNAPAAPAYQPAPAHYNAPAPSYNQHSYNAPNYGTQYQGPLAKPEVTPQGFLAETPEVAAAKAAHFAEVAKAGSQGPHHRYRRSAAVLVHTPASNAPLAVAYAAPVAYTYAAPYTYPPYSGYAYSVKTW